MEDIKRLHIIKARSNVEDFTKHLEITVDKMQLEENLQVEIQYSTTNNGTYDRYSALVIGR